LTENWQEETLRKKRASRSRHVHYHSRDYYL
jgi:hypothetical protein